MITRFFSLLFALSIPLITFSQKTSKYYDINWQETKPENAFYYSDIEKKDSLWKKYDYYIRPLKLRSHGTYKDSSFKIPCDTFYYFYPNGILEKTGRFTDSKKEGLWLSYHYNGMLRDSTVYENDKPVGSSLSWHYNGYLSDSTYYAPDGSSVSVKWFDNGAIASAGRYNAAGQKYGKWQFFTKEAKPFSLETYDNGILKAKNYLDENGNPVTDTTGYYLKALDLTDEEGWDKTFTKTEIEAEYIGGTIAWNRYLVKTLRYPSQAAENGIQGIVVVEFIVDKDGTVSNVTAISGPETGGLKEIAIELVKKSGKWIPAIQNGHKVRAYKRLPITFKLDN